MAQKKAPHRSGKGKKPTVRKASVRKPKRAAPARHTAGAARRRNREAILRIFRRATLHDAARRPHTLERHEQNPIIEPRGHSFWEMKATFNPGAVYADGRVHLLYRAIGGDDVSVLGYAASDDGMTIRERLAEPAYVPSAIKKIELAAPPEHPIYLSGGGWNGGCEDPRLTLIDGTICLTYTAFDGWGSVRIALSSIKVDDFLRKRWNWTKPALISPPGEIHKNWVVFPEKINGKYAILHSISPRVQVDYFDSLDHFDRDDTVIRSNYDRVSRSGGWDSWIRGAGPPPIRTKLGWLLFYHAMDVRDPNRYKLGAMVLDANDPTKILYRTRSPVLEPDAHYENSGFKSGVVYSCGAVVKDGELFVYYGGGDSVVCVAMANLNIFLDDLKRYGTPKLATQGSKKPKHGRR